MEYLNRAVLDAVAEDAFRNRQPYPWTNLENTLTPEGYEALRQSLPDTTQRTSRWHQARLWARVARSLPAALSAGRNDFKCVGGFRGGVEGRSIRTF